MRIAIFVHCFFPDHMYGTEAYTLMLAKELRSLGHEVLIVSATHIGEPAQEELIYEYKFESIDVWAVDKNKVPHVDLGGTYYQPEIRWIYERLIRRWKPDVVHVNHIINHTAALLDVLERMDIPAYGTLTDFFGFCLNNKLETADNTLCAGPNASRSNCISCHIKAANHNLDTHGIIRASQGPILRRIAATLLAQNPRLGGRHEKTIIQIKERPGLLLERYNRVYKGLVAPSTFLKQSYQQNGLTAPIMLSHFGIDVDRAPKPPSPTPNVTRIGYVGQIAPHKGVHILVDAFISLGSDALSLDIWGPSDQDARYYHALTERTVGKAVRFRGTFPSSKIAEVMAEVDILVIPSTWYENSPLILLQALATHTPVVVSDVLGLIEFIEEGVSGFRFERGNADALATLLAKFAEDKGLAARMSATTFYAATPRDMALDVLRLYGQSAPSTTNQSLEKAERIHG